MTIAPLRLEVRLVLQKAQRERTMIRGHAVEVKESTAASLITPIAIPTPGSSEQPPLTLLLFEEHQLTESDQMPAPSEDGETAFRVRELEHELAATRDHLQTNVEDLETSNEELQSINEEFQSTSEELQSSNEEFQTTNEELQSTNEELQTVNDELKVKSEELARANADLQNILNTSLSGIIVMDRERRVTRYSAASKDLFRLWPTNIGQSLTAAESAIDLTLLSAEIDQALQPGREVDRDLQLGERIFAIRLIPHREDGDDVSGLIIAFQDETDKRKAEADARRLAAVVRDSHDAVTVHALDGRIISWNGGAERMYGYSEAEALAMNMRQLIPEDQQEHALAMVAAVADGKDIAPFEIIRETKDGRRIDVSLVLTLLRDDHGQPIAIASTERDITEAKRDARFRAISDSAPDATIVVDGEGKIKQANARMVDLFGYSRDEFLDMPVHHLIPKGHQAAHDGYLKAFFADPHFRPMGKGLDLFGTTKDGRDFSIDVNLSPIRLSDELLVAASIRDITDQKEIEKELRRARDQLEQRVEERTQALEDHQEQLIQAQKMEAVGQLTGGVAHDFNNLLTVIMGNLEMLEMRLGDDETARRSLTQAQEAAELGAQLTSRLLAFGRRQSLEPKVVDLNELVLEMGDLLRRTLGETNQINTTLASELQTTNTDPMQLQNALLNLCLNARDAMPEGGELTIETTNIDIDQDAAESYRDIAPGAYVRLSVTDTGSGMAPEVRDRVFEPFFTTKEVGQGSGLGLSMVYGFTKQSGGHVLIYSEQGRGTTISLYLPRIEDDPEIDHQDDEEGAALSAAQGETILVVEDDARVRQVTVSRLQILGYKVLEAENGPTALQQLQQNPKVDLLFTDVVMPGGMTGRDLGEQVQKQHPEIKILYTSGYAAQANGPAGLLDEDTPWLRKPYGREDLARKLRSVLDG